MSSVQIRPKSRIIGSRRWYQRWAVVVDDGQGATHMPAGSNSYVHSWHFFKLSALLRAIEVYMEQQS